MSKAKILVVEDEELMRITLKDSLLQEGYEVTVASDGLQGFEAVKATEHDIALVDLKMPRMNGIELLREIQNHSPGTLAIMMTAYGTVETAVEAMRLGAYDFITKPFLIDELLLVLDKVLEVRRLRGENVLLQQALSDRYSLGNIIGKCKRMQDVFNLIETSAQGEFTVLIVGETGTGKELVAHAIHHLSPRKKRPFIKVSCAILSDTLLESELFGHEKGAFTGAIKKKLGRFEMADGGTLFLDDVDDMDTAAQVKLLRILQEREFERVGGTQTIAVNVRVVAATKVDLEEKVKDGTFREDLYYRLNVVPVYLPPLREKREDIPLLIQHFLQRFSQKTNTPLKHIVPDALNLMINYAWPGNVRELENVIERLIALVPGDDVLINNLPSKIAGTAKVLCPVSSELQPLETVVKQAEIEYIQRVLEKTRGKKKEAADILGISRKTLWEKLKLLDQD